MSMHTQQVSGKSEQKSSETATPSETARGAKPVRSAADGQRIPAWAIAWGDGLPPGLRLQTKLTVSQPGDPYEQEADGVAEQVLRTTDLQTSVSAGQDQPKHALMRKQDAEPSADAPGVPPIVHDTLNSGGGQPLDPTTRAFMEPRFGHDFSGVRVHTDAKSAESARAINAQAYTVGRDVVFGAGQFNPGTGKGTRLIAHELVHYLQQTGGQVSPATQVQRSPDDKGGEEGKGGVESPYEEEQEVIRYAVGAHELGKFAKGTVLYNAKDWKATAISDSTFYVGPFTSDMGNFYYVYRFTGSDPETSIYMLSRGTYLPGPDTKDLQASLAQVQGGKTLKFKTTGLIPPSGGAVAKTVKKDVQKGGAEKKTGEESASKPEGAEDPEVLTPQRKKWLTTGRDNMKHEIIALLNEIQKVKASRIDTWEKNANIKDPKPIKEALEVAVEVVGYGMGGVVGGLLTKAMAHGLAQEFAKEALLKSTVKLAEAIFAHAVEPAEEFMEEATKKALQENQEGNAAAALATKSSLLDCYVEATKLQTISEEHVQTREFNATVDAKYPDIALADLVLTFESLYDTLFKDPKSFLRELSVGLIRLKDEVYLHERAEKYGGDVSRLLKEDPTIHETPERSGNLLLVGGGMRGIGEWSKPDFSFGGFYALASGVNNATLMELKGTAVKDLPVTLTFRFWANNPFKGWGLGILWVDPNCHVWFERRSDGIVWVDLDESGAGLFDTAEERLEWLASYYLQTSRELTEAERERYAPEGARKVYDHIKDKPVLDLSNTDIFDQLGLFKGGNREDFVKISKVPVRLPRIISRGGRFLQGTLL